MASNEYFLTIGLQRTGTKWLSQLIKENFEIQEAEYVWKHLTPLGVYTDRLVPEKDIALSVPEYFSWERMEDAIRNYFILAIYRDYDHWYNSLLKNNDPDVHDPYSNVDFFDTHKVDRSLPYGVRVSTVYSSWRQWIDTIKDQDNVYFTSYNNWLKDPYYHLNAVYEKSGFIKTHEDWVTVDFNLDNPDAKFVKT